MKIEETKEVKIEVENVKNIKCDICGKHVLGKNKENGYGASLVGFRFFLEEGKGTLEQNESSDFCEKCYSSILSFLRDDKKAKVPSFYYNIDVLDRLDEEQNTDKRM